MMKKLSLAITLVAILGSWALTQVPITTGIQILKAEDARRYDTLLEGLMRSPNADVRVRAALAAGRIGDQKAVPALADLLKNDPSEQVKAMAAFALGETESIAAGDAVLNALGNYGQEEAEA